MAYKGMMILSYTVKFKVSYSNYVTEGAAASCSNKGEKEKESKGNEKKDSKMNKDRIKTDERFPDKTDQLENDNNIEETDDIDKSLDEENIGKQNKSKS